MALWFPFIICNVIANLYICLPYVFSGNSQDYAVLEGKLDPEFRFLLLTIYEENEGGLLAIGFWNYDEQRDFFVQWCLILCFLAV